MSVNTTIEERVTILELQVTELAGDVDAVEDEVILISSDQISQDERILELEIDANGNTSNYLFTLKYLCYFSITFSFFILRFNIFFFNFIVARIVLKSVFCPTFFWNLHCVR